MAKYQQYWSISNDNKVIEMETCMMNARVSDAKHIF